jgi:hypothetical protein
MTAAMWRLAGNGSYELLPNTAFCDAFIVAILRNYVAVSTGPSGEGR